MLQEQALEVDKSNPDAFDDLCTELWGAGIFLRNNEGNSIALMHNEDQAPAAAKIIEAHETRMRTQPAVHNGAQPNEAPLPS